MPDNETIYSNDSSFYEAYDPFEYLVDKTQRQVLEEEEENIYATIAEKGLKIDFTYKLFKRNLISRKKCNIFFIGIERHEPIYGLNTPTKHKRHNRQSSYFQVRNTFKTN